MAAASDCFAIDALLTEARAATGLSDFGADDFRDPLRMRCPA